MKPILFNTEMVRAILDGRKSCTRRAIKEPVPFLSEDKHRGRLPVAVYINGISWLKAPYQPGDILWVRETWQLDPTGFNEMPPENWWIYKASNVLPDTCTKWRPSIHMPREAARLFLRVTDVRVEKLRGLSIRGLREEGISQSEVFTWADAEKFKEIWDSTIKPADRALYGWDANPWVWVIEFARISREEASPHA